ncbi:peptidoglycan DD-metalloendopeptidase family protein [Luminiphilus sp.]|nr:peptidoglycan DD-metalloendopeptidase family protein [Luminiphilus sp.]
MFRKRTPLMHRLTIITSLMMLLTSGHLTGQSSKDTSETESQLSTLREDIAAIRTQLDAQEEALDGLQDTLGRTERSIGELNQQLTASTQEKQRLQEKLTSLRNENDVLKEDQIRLEADVEAGIRQLWMLQQGGGLRVWLGDQDPQQTARHLAYYRLILEEQQHSIERYQQGVANIAARVNAILRTESDLTARAAAIAATREQLTAEQDTRRQTIARINTQLKQDQAELDALILNQNRLNMLLERLQAIALPASPASQPFAALRGQLTMPIEGKPINRFGAIRNADLRWRGWLIPAEQGDPIRAVHGGRVIFADWLRGQGLLLVVDHGDEWLSLYAQNHSLLRAVGDWVSSGEVLSLAGATGGNEMNGLYFEIRHQGEPVDPADWFRR